MQLLLATLISLALVYALIRFLHARQVRRNQEIADQGMPLPPLEKAGTSFSATENSGIGVSPAVIVDGTGQSNWRDEVKALRDTGRFQEALALCSRQYPRMLAFRQTMITLRSQLKSGDEAPEQALKEIYRTAILASLAKARQPQAGADSDISAQLPGLEDPRQYWDELGYRKLELLTKTDRNLLARFWGEPRSHNEINQLLDRLQ